MGWRARQFQATLETMDREERLEAGRRIYNLRRAKGWSQEDLAHEAQLSVKTVSRLEKGEHEGRRSTIEQIAEALGVAGVDILGEPPAPFGPSARQEDMHVGFEEFRAYVRELKAGLAGLDGRLDTADADRMMIRQLLSEQAELLHEQSLLLERLRETVRVLPAIDVLLRQLPADAAAPTLPPGDAEDAPGGVERRRGDRRRSG